MKRTPRSARRRASRQFDANDPSPGFFTPYAYVRYLIDKPLQLTGPITADDLRMSEKVPTGEHQPA